MLALFAALYVLWRRVHARLPGLVTGAYLVGYALIRFALEYFRGDPRAAVGPFSISQTISLALLIAGFFFMAVAILRGKR